MYADLERGGVDDVGDALVDGHPAADGEDADGHDEAPEVDLHAVAERVLLVGGLRAAAQAVVEQDAVAGVHQGVDALGDHGRAAGEPGGHELDGGDGHVADDRGDDGFLGFGCHARPVYTVEGRRACDHTLEAGWATLGCMELNQRGLERAARLIEKGVSHPGSVHGGHRRRRRPFPHIRQRRGHLPRLPHLRGADRDLRRGAAGGRSARHRRGLLPGTKGGAEGRLPAAVRLPGEGEHGLRRTGARGLPARGRGQRGPLRGSQADHPACVRHSGQSHQLLRLPHDRRHRPRQPQRGRQLLHPLQLHPRRRQMHPVALRRRRLGA